MNKIVQAEPVISGKFQKSPEYRELQYPWLARRFCPTLSALGFVRVWSKGMH
jgi:hypothetical protein